MNYTEQLQPGDMVQRRSDGRLWVMVDAVHFGNDVYNMRFLDLGLREVVSYTSPWGLKLPSAFTIV